MIEYSPVGLFSLKSSLATSTVGKTLLVPTPYAIKMALVDAAFRAGRGYDYCANFTRLLAEVDIRIASPQKAVVTHTFVKVRQESRKNDPLRPYGGNIAYREVVYHDGTWRWAFSSRTPDAYEAILEASSYVNCIGKRGCFIQYMGFTWVDSLGMEYTQPVDGCREWVIPPRCHIAELDDFGP
ncbi:MAG: hypothetical protein AB1700_17120, partial [Bacillota bacterium]